METSPLGGLDQKLVNLNLLLLRGEGLLLMDGGFGFLLLQLLQVSLVVVQVPLVLDLLRALQLLQLGSLLPPVDDASSDLGDLDHHLPSVNLRRVCCSW